MKIIILLLSIVYSSQVSADNLSDSNQLFDWAEINFPEYFSPSGSETFELEFQQQVYLVRFYEDTNTYIGTLEEEVLVFGDVFNGLLNVGLISDFIQTGMDDISGVWDYSGQDNASACGEGISTYSRILTITVNGDQMTAVSNSGNIIKGTVNGDTVSTSNQYSEDGGITNETGFFVVSGNSFSGNSNWSWSNGSFTCAGTTTHSGTRR